ncbi:MAG: DUF3995 domain-containing protein [Microbacterium sp.]|nr:MAG: DUF3995 domain-containing protein [Microbacterium sp.]
MRGNRTVARAAVLVAFAVGTVHAAASLYWALGGRWLLPTVGEWAVRAAQTAPTQAALLLGAIGLVKLAAAGIPVGVEWGVVSWAPFWRVICWIGGVGLVIYGGINIVVSGAVLLGIVRPEGGYDADAMIGHAFLWDPLFLIWGIALVIWLRASGTPRPRRLEG